MTNPNGPTGPKIKIVDPEPEKALTLEGYRKREAEKVAFVKPGRKG